MASFTFGVYRLDTDTGTLWRGKDTLALTGKLWDVLYLLVQRPGELVALEAISSAVWGTGGASVETVARAVRRLRVTLGDPPDEPLYIESVYGRGFRFIAPVSFSRDGGSRRVFVGRAAELAELHRLQVCTRTDGARVALVMGDAGIGKTSLLDHFLDDLAFDEGVRVGHAACIESIGTPEPFAPLLAVFGDWLHGDDGTIAAMLIAHAPTWARELRIESDRLRAGDSGSLERMPRECIAFLAALARERPTVLVFDDSRWIDAATVSIVTALTRRRERIPLLVVCAARRSEVGLSDVPFRALYGASLDPAHVARIDLTPLDEEALGHLLEQRAASSARSAPLRHALNELSGGHPLLASCLIEDWTARGLLDDIAAGRLVPDIGTAVDASRAHTIGVLLGRRLDMLDGASVRAIEAASVAGTAFDSREVTAATGDEHAQRRLDELAHHQFLIETCGSATWQDGTTGHAYRFRHALLRAPLLDRVVPGVSDEWRRAIVERLESGYGADIAPVLARLLAHAHELGEHGRVLKYETAAAHSAVRRLSYTTAADHLLEASAAAAHLPESPAMTGTRASLALQAASAIFHGHGAGDARIDTLIDRARGLARAIGAGRLEFLTHLVGTGYRMRRCDTHAAMEECVRMVELATERDPSLLATALMYRGLASAIGGRLPQAHEDFARALTMERDPKVPGGICFERMVRMYDALVLTAQGFSAAADESFAAAQEAALREGNAFDEVDLAYFRGLAAVRVQQPQDAQRHAARVLALDAEHGFARHVPGATLIREWARPTSTRAAVARMREVHEQRRGGGELWDDTFCSYLRGDVALRAGEVEEAARINEAARGDAADSGELFFLSELWRQAGCIAMARGGSTSTRDARAAFREAMRTGRDQDAGYSQWAAAEEFARCGPLGGEDERGIEAARTTYESRRRRPVLAEQAVEERSGFG